MPRNSLASTNPLRSATKVEALTKRLARIRPDGKGVDGHILIAQTLQGLGVTHVYGISGTPIHETLAACSKIGIRAIGVRHQQAAVMMATAQNYVAGRLTAVTICSSGPGITNAATGILVAKDNCWPVIVLGGRRPLKMRERGSFQELDAVPLFHSITKWAACVETTSQIPEYLGRAFHLATHGRPGPVYLDLAEEALNGKASQSDFPIVHPVNAPALSSDAIKRATEILLTAKRPAIIFGKGVRWSDAYLEVQELVDTLCLPFITSPMGRGFLPDDHPLCFNRARGLLQAQADVILLVGARLDWTFRFGTELAPDVKLIHVDIHSEEIGLNRTPTVGITGDAKRVLREILKHVKRKKSEQTGEEKRKLWLSMLNARRESNLDALEQGLHDTSIPMTPQRVMKEIRDVLPRDAICLLDGNVSMTAAQEILPSFLPASRFTPGTNGCMGVGIPFAIGAKLVHRDRPVVVICGDFAFGLNAMEMETAVRFQIPIIIIVINNQGPSGGLNQKKFYPTDHERVAMFLPHLHYEEIMLEFGGHAEFIDRPEQISSAFSRARESGLPACLNVQVDPYSPFVKPRG